MKLTAYGASDMGLFRTINEDSFFIDLENSLFIVADGLGGLEGGEVASKLAIGLFVQDFKKNQNAYPKRFKTVFNNLTKAVYKNAEKMGYLDGMGTTFSVGLIIEDVIHIAHIGDTLIACLRDGEMTILTKDHTEAQYQIDQLPPGGDVVLYDAMEHSLTGCIGQYENLNIQQSTFSLLPGDRILLCSDGLTKTALYPEIREKCLSKPTPKGVVSKLLAVANSRGGPDNTTVVFVAVEQ